MVQPVGLSDRPEHAAVFGDAMNGWLEGRGLSDTPAPLLQRQPSRSDGRPPAAIRTFVAANWREGSSLLVSRSGLPGP
jgi:hypothetical protein